jgi:hypothetical protein
VGTHTKAENYTHTRTGRNLKIVTVKRIKGICANETGFQVNDLLNYRSNNNFLIGKIPILSALNFKLSFLN